MQGHFDVKLLDASQHRQALRQLERGGSNEALSQLLHQLPVVQQVQGSNLIFDNFAAHIFFTLFSGGDVTDPFDTGGVANNAYFSTICLQTTDTEPAYTDFGTQSSTGDAVTGSIGGTVPAKRFIEDDVEAELVQVDPGGREAITCRSRFLWSSSEGNSANIKSLGVWYCADADGSIAANLTRATSARIRLKDGGGSPITIIKDASKVMLVEYTFTLAAI